MKIFIRATVLLLLNPLEDAIGFSISKPQSLVPVKIPQNSLCMKLKMKDDCLPSKKNWSSELKKTASAVLGVGTLVFGLHQNVHAEEVPTAISSSVFQSQQNLPKRVRYSEFLELVESDEINKVFMPEDGQNLVGFDNGGNTFKLDAIPADPDLPQILHEHEVDVVVIEKKDEAAMMESYGGSLVAPALFLTAIYLLFTRQQGGSIGGGGRSSGDSRNDPAAMGQSRSIIQLNPNTGIKFHDVAGCDNAKLELMEVVDFLKKPQKYTQLGARIPRGVLMQGPPGTGKTLLAKAVAGEAGVPFISTTGSEFVEMFVGVGASRVRDLFGKAKENSPCIIFIDEIDAVGRQRGAGIAGGHDEREQTLNQILVELDGFEGNSGVIVIAATNRADILDAALLRPGRFDRRVTVDLPDFNGRRSILKVHCRGKPLSPDVDLDSIARRTPGFSGAGLQNLMNEAAISAAREERKVIVWEDVDRALDRILVGLEKKGDMEHVKERQEVIAFHEAGHAIVGALIPDYDMVQKVSIIPRTNGAGGVTFFSPNEIRLESGLYTKQYLEAQLAVALGGRVAEEIVFGDDFVTTGASNDLQQVANVAKMMICNYGFSDKIGPITVGTSERDGPFQGRDMYAGQQDGWSKETITLVDEEVEHLVNKAYLVAKDILLKNKGILFDLAERLLEQDTVSADELSMMLIVAEKVYMAPYNLLCMDDSNGDGLPYKKDLLPSTAKAPE